MGFEVNKMTLAFDYGHVKIDSGVKGISVTFVPNANGEIRRLKAQTWVYGVAIVDCLEVDRAKVAREVMAVAHFGKYQSQPTNGDCAALINVLSLVSPI